MSSIPKIRFKGLVNMFGKEFVIEQTGSNRIKFIQLDSPIKVSVENEMIF